MKIFKINKMIIGVLKEPSFETRVSLLAESAAALIKKGNKLIVESGAGDKSFNNNQEYEKVGAEIKSRAEVLEQADILLSIHPLQDEDFAKVHSKILLGVYQPLSNEENVIKSIERKITTFSLIVLSHFIYLKRLKNKITWMKTISIWAKISFWLIIQHFLSCMEN